jgi:hypothetical protein
MRQAGRLLTRRKIVKKESILVSDCGRIMRHIIPTRPYASEGDHARRRGSLHHDVAAGSTAGRTKTELRGLSFVRGGRGVASRAVGLLGAIFTYAIRKGMRIDNPAHGVVRFADQRRDRRLTDDEYRRLGAALATADQDGT